MCPSELAVRDNKTQLSLFFLPAGPPSPPLLVLLPASSSVAAASASGGIIRQRSGDGWIWTNLDRVGGISADPELGGGRGQWERTESGAQLALSRPHILRLPDLVGLLIYSLPSPEGKDVDLCFLLLAKSQFFYE